MAKARNLGVTTLARRRPRTDPMQEFDKLPPALRAWLASASLPWRPASVKAAFQRASQRTGNPSLALKELDRIERTLIAKDAHRMWGDNHPAARVD